MNIESDSIFQWLVAAIGGIISVLAGMAIWNNRTRFKTLDDRLSKVEDRINVEIPNAIADLKTELAEVKGSINGMNTKVEIISDNITQRMDKLEMDLPRVVEAAMYRTVLNRGVAASHIDEPTM